ncbi:A24 family peptidase [Aliivibrio fischeri]|uniref:A24 family peptidase n=1 Tax=Aliivibrio fischeri TaxID=668 RepID=UPI00084CB3B4|nr:prepilin peptidase [Aliivibrio fischeri]OED58167.1 type IV leader peptidase [Aliivibrio fischeri]
MKDIFFFWWLLLATISLIVCFYDIKKRVISNKVCLIIFLICSVICYFMQNYDSYKYTLSIFTVGFILFRLNIIGGGDVKLMLSFSIAVLPKYQLLTIVVILFGGGLMAIGQLIYLKILQISQMDAKSRGVPYGVPICVGYLFFISVSLLGKL